MKGGQCFRTRSIYRMPVLFANVLPTTLSSFRRLTRVGVEALIVGIERALASSYWLLVAGVARRSLGEGGLLVATYSVREFLWTNK